MDVLQLVVPLLAISDPELSDETRDGNLRKAIRLISRIPVAHGCVAQDKKRS